MHEEIQQRKKDLKAVVDYFLKVNQQWGESDVSYLTEEYEQALNDMIFVFNTGHLPENFRQLDRVVQNISSQWDRYRNTVSAVEDGLPSQTFFRTVEQLTSALRETEPRRRPPLESIEELTRQKVSDKQICDIYGWVDEDGSPQLHILAEERREPGRHVNDTFIPPLERRDLEEQQRQAEIVARVTARTTSKAKNLTTPAPEPWEQLFDENLTAPQIAKMKRCSIDAVFEQATALGYPPPAMSYSDARYNQSPETESDTQQPPPTPARQNPHLPPTAAEELAAESEEDPPSLEEEIALYAEQGLTPSDIAKAVSTEQEKISVQKVTAVLRSIKEPADSAS